MPAKGRAFGALVKYGPAVAAAAQRYGPTVAKQLRQSSTSGVGPLRQSTSGSRKKAISHAQTVVDGKVQQVFHLSEPYWIVFSGDDPVGVHPRTSVSYEQLLRHADPANRMRPEDVRRSVELPRRRKSGTATPPRKPGQSGQSGQSGQRPTA